MYNLASTADEYLSPSIEYMVNKFKISESLAGVTLMALGSGAPDVFSSISAALSSTPDLDTGFVGENYTPACSLLGSCVFLTSFVITLIGWAS
jgi:sodium/potassium/calcium exchanger 6